MSSDVFFQSFAAGESSGRGGHQMREVLAPHVGNKRGSHWQIRFGDGAADVYLSDDGMIASDISGRDPWNLLVRGAKAADWVILPLDCPVCLTGPGQREERPEDIGDEVVVVDSGADLRTVVKSHRQRHERVAWLGHDLESWSMTPCRPSGASSDPALEERIHAVLGLVGKEVRADLLFKLIGVGGSKSLPLLTSILARDVPSTAEHRQAAVQAVHKILGVEGIALYRAALTDRDIFVQILALAALRCDDHNGQAASDVEAWVTRRLKGHKTRKLRTYQEVPLAIGYFSSIRQLETIAKLLHRYEDQLDRTDRHMVEHIWSTEDRRRWAQAETAREPDLTEMGYLGFSDDFIHLMQCEAEGIEPGEMRSGETMTAEEEARFFSEWHQDFLVRLERLERRQSAMQR